MASWLVTPVFVAALYIVCSQMFPQSSGKEGAFGHGWSGYVAFAQRVAVMGLGLVKFGTPIVLLGPFSQIVKGSELVANLRTGGFCVLVAVGSWRSAPPVSRAIVALLLVAMSQYLMVALGRATAYRQSGMSSEAVLRYHYAPLALLAAVAGIAAHSTLAGLFARLGAADVTALWLAGTAFVLGRHPIAIDPALSARMEVTAFVSKINALVACGPAGTPLFIRNRRFVSIGPVVLQLVPELFPGWAAVFTVYFPNNTVAGREIYFVASGENTLAAARAQPQSRIARLLVSPAEAGVPGVAEPMCGG